MIIYELWAFVAPAFTASEKKYFYPVVFATAPFVVLPRGSPWAYFLVLPRGLFLPAHVQRRLLQRAAP